MFNSFDIRMFHAAKMEAEKSTFDRFHVGAVVVYKNKIIGRGHNSNKTHPAQQFYNERYRNFNNVDGAFIKHSVHAELASLNDVSFIVGKNIDWSKAKIYVYRISAGRKNGYGLSKPCPACMAAIRDVGIKHVYYTDNDGLAYLRLD